jgi:hypothetical protein
MLIHLVQCTAGLLLLLVDRAAPWETHEHIVLGDTATLTFADGSQHRVNETYFTLPNNNSLRFSEILALAGDLYGLPDSPISDSVGSEAQQATFIKHLETLITAPDAPDGIPNAAVVVAFNAIE